jgi:hypothetical protein
MSLPWDKQKVTESTVVHEVAEKFIEEPTVITRQCQVSDFWNADSIVGRGAVINIYNFLKRLDVTVYKSRCERREPPPHHNSPPKPGRCPTGAEVLKVTPE